MYTHTFFDMHVQELKQNVIFYTTLWYTKTDVYVYMDVCINE